MDYFGQEIEEINEQLKKAIKRLSELDHYAAGEVFKSNFKPYGCLFCRVEKLFRRVGKPGQSNVHQKAVSIPYANKQSSYKKDSF